MSAPPPELLARDVDAEIASPRWHLGFAPAVEASFEADRGEARRRGIVSAGLVALLVYDAFLLNDWSLRPDAFREAVLWRLGVMTPYGLATLGLVRAGVRPAIREALLGTDVVVAMFASGMLFLATPDGAGIYDPFAFCLVFLAGNIALPLRFVHAAVTSAVALALALGCVHLSPHMPDEARQFATGSLVGTAVFTGLACFRMERGDRRSYLLLLREELRAEAARREAEAFAAMSHTDALTQIPNRRAFDAALAARWTAAAEAGEAVALLLLDIDHFKRFNDRYGHPAGDACLARVAGTLRDQTRGGDVACRVGGEEFGVVLATGDRAGAEAVAERLRRAVEALAIPHGEGQPVVTVSIGIGIASPSDGRGLSALVTAADTGLYEAKRQGRNRWVTHG